MKKSICFLYFLWIVGGVSFAHPNDLLRLKENYIRLLLANDPEKDKFLQLIKVIPAEEERSDQNIAELYQRFPIGQEEADVLTGTLKEDGSWEDINYDDRKRSGWEPKKHAERLLALTKFYYRNHGGEDSVRLREAIHRAMNFWFRRKFTCLNWWYNQIGIPRTLGPVFLLFEKEMSMEQKEAAIREMKYSKFGMTGQNKVWLAGNVLIRGLLEEDYGLVKAARDTIVSEIVLGKAEGIQSDWSFHQHGPQQQFGNYGLSFLSNMCMYAELFANTSLAVTDEQLRILVSLFEEGYQWIVWKGRWDVNSLNRQLFRNADIYKSFTLLFSVHSLMQGCVPEQRGEMETFIRSNFTSGRKHNYLKGNKMFWDSDQMIHRTDYWMASVKGASRRVIGTELVNEDNKQGYYMADGALYVYTDGDEYHNIFPCWDWRKIPGITCVNSPSSIPTRYGASTLNQASFVGGITDGETGMMTMELNRDGLKALKTWIFTDECIVCIGSGITSSSLPAVTTVEQCRQQGDLLRLTERGKWVAVPEGGEVVTGKQRYFHRNTGYIIIDADSCYAQTGACSGRWFDVMGVYPPKAETEELLSICLPHLPGQSGAYQYLILPASSVAKVKRFPAEKIRFLANREKLQLVGIADRDYAVVREPVDFHLPDGTAVQASTPGLYLFRKGRLVAASDPSRTKKILQVIINDKKFELPVDAHGFVRNIFPL